MNVLMVGAGTVGQTYGQVLSDGGADVSFYVRPKYRERIAEGTRVFPGRGRAKIWRPESVLSSVEELAGRSFDQVWLTMSSTALDQPWREPFLEATGDAAVAVLQNGLGDRERVSRQIGEARTVSGLINLIAWNAPLPGAEGEEGVAWITPPFAAQPLSGARAGELVAGLRAGGMRARVVDDAARAGMFGGAALQPMIASLELAGWRFSSWKREMAAGARAAREALDVAAALYDRPAPLGLRLAMRAPLLRAGLPIASAAFPADLETYLRVHFTKVGDQTASSMKRLVDAGRARGVDVEGLDALRARLVEARESR
jgi:2-dehydropantoate 2-reductase